LVCEDIDMTTIRRATTADAHGLAVVRVRGWQVGYAGIIDAEFLSSMSVDENAGRWQQIIEGHVHLQQTLVAVVDDQVVGFASIGPYRSGFNDDKSIDEATVLAEPGTVGELTGFYVHPDHWGTGVANVLHEAAYNTLRADGWVSLKLWVLEANARARRFYERHGWTADGDRAPLPLPGLPIEVRYGCAAR
jgi:GNAT superfamily N-acetyltransferase